MGKEMRGTLSNYPSKISLPSGASWAISQHAVRDDRDRTRQSDAGLARR
jgi:hypothetical protein